MQRLSGTLLVQNYDDLMKKEPVLVLFWIVFLMLYECFWIGFGAGFEAGSRIYSVPLQYRICLVFRVVTEREA